MDDINTIVSGAVAEAKTELGGTTAAPEPEVTAPETVADPTPDPTPKPEPTPAKVEEPEPEEEFFNPTAAELALIEQSPELKKAYRALRKGFTEKTTALAKERKELKERADIADWVQQNPEKAARRLAELSGLSIAEARAEVREAKDTIAEATDDLTKLWKEKVGDDAAPILRPLIEQTAQAVAEKLIAPFRAQTEELTTAAQRRGIAASVSEFGATVIQQGGEWSEEIQTEMAELSNKISPAKDATVEEYLGALHDIITTRHARSQTTRANLTRLRRIRDEAEPVNPSRPSPKSEEAITHDMSDKDAVAIAVRQARREAVGR